MTNLYDFKKSATVNIGVVLHGDDAYFRYKRSSVVAKPLAKKGGMTEWVNASVISTQLHCPLPLMLSSIQSYLALGKIQTKNNIVIIPTTVIKETIEKALEKFIETNILCPTCKLPEIDMKHKKCNACGSGLSPPTTTKKKKIKTNILREKEKEKAKRMTIRIMIQLIMGTKRTSLITSVINEPSL